MNAIIRTTPPSSIALRLYNGKYHSCYSYCARLAYYVWDYWSIYLDNSSSVSIKLYQLLL